LDLWKHIGERALHHGQGERAETCFLTVAAHQPYRTELWQALGDLAAARREWDVAYERYCKAAEMNRNQVGVWWPLAERFLTLGNPQRAADCLEHLSDVWSLLPGDWPKTFAVYRAAGSEMAFLERLEAELARDLLPRRHWADLARLYTEAGKRERAAECLKRLDPEMEKVEQYFLLARQHLERQEPGEALAQLKQLQALRKNDPAFWMLLGDAHYQAGNINDARQAYEQAVALDEKEFRAWFRLGNLRFRSRQLEQASEAFRRATGLNGNEPKGWYNLGCVQTEQGLLAEAKASFERALKLDRRFDQAWNWLGIVHVNLRDPDRARHCYVRCVAINRGSATGWANLASLYTSLGRPKDAAVCQERSQRASGMGQADAVTPVRLFHDRGRA
jgi:tetratricopeptide (TPR) repeat protein